MHMSITTIVLSLILAILPVAVATQEQSSATGSSQCSQPAEEQNALIREAERDHYTTRRVEFIGNNYTRDMVLRRRINIGLNEGDLFTRRNLIRSLRNVNTLKVIYPVKVADVELHLNHSEKTVDMIICFKEKVRWSSQRAIQQALGADSP